MADLVALKAALDAAEAAKAALVDERRAKRPVMTRGEFRDYSAATHQKQLDVTAAVTKAQAEFSVAAGRVKEDAINVALGTITETEGGG